MTEKNRLSKYSFTLRAGICLLAIAVWLLSLYVGEKPAPAVKQGQGNAISAAPPAMASATAIKAVTPEDYAKELDPAGNVLVQLCKPEQCAADFAVLERLKPSFAGVKFVQMNSADNPDFANRLEKEQELMVKGDSSIGPLVYPVYVFKSSDLQVAPPLKSEEELEQFIATNAASDVPEIGK
jgi:hypothetical protein